MSCLINVYVEEDGFITVAPRDQEMEIYKLSGFFAVKNNVRINKPYKKIDEIRQ